MSEAEQTAWHGLTAEEAVERLKSNVTAGLDDAEAARRQGEYGLNLLPTARKRGPFMRFLEQFNNVLVYVLLAAGFTKLMMGLWLELVDHPRRGGDQRTARLPSGRPGGKVSQFDPQHALGRSANPAQRPNRR